MTISDTAGDSITDEISISSAAPVKLAFASQPKFIAGHSAVSVSVLDTYGNLSTAADGATVTLRLAPRPALSNHPALRETLSAKVINGLATFPNVTINRAVRDQLIATAGKLRQAQSSVFKAS